MLLGPIHPFVNIHVYIQKPTKLSNDDDDHHVKG